MPPDEFWNEKVKEIYSRNHGKSQMGNPEKRLLIALSERQNN